MTTSLGGDPTNPGQEPAQPSGGENVDNNSLANGSEEISREEIEKIRKRLDDSQAYIKQLEDEGKATRDMIAEYEAKSKEASTVEELLARMRNEQQASSARNEEPTAPVVNVDELVDTATQRTMDRLSEQQRSAQEAQNLSFTADELQKVYGDKYSDQVNSRAKELGMDVAEIDRLAKTSPKAAIALIKGERGAASMSAPTQGGVTGIQGGQGDDLSYFAKLRKEDVNAFYSPEVQKQYRMAIVNKAKKEGRL